MNKEKLRKQINKIINEEIYSEGKTFNPSKKDLERNPHMHPGFEHVVMGKRKAVQRIMELLKEQ